MTTETTVKPLTMAQRARLVQDNLDVLQAKLTELNSLEFNSDTLQIIQITMRQLYYMDKICQAQVDAQLTYKLQRDLTKILLANTHRNCSPNGAASVDWAYPNNTVT